MEWVYEKLGGNNYTTIKVYLSVLRNIFIGDHIQLVDRASE